MHKTKELVKVVALLGLMAVAVGCQRIGPGHVGIVVSQAGSSRGVEETPATTGWVFYNPLLTNVYEYPTYVQQVTWTHSLVEGNPVNEEITFTNKDQMKIAVDISLAYHIEAAKVPAFYTKFRSDNLNNFTNGYMRSLARDKFNEIGGKYPIEAIMGDNSKFIAEVKEGLQQDLSPIGVVLESQFGIIGAPRPPDSVLQAISMKVQAVQIAQQKQNEVIQAEADARKAVAQANGQAQSTLALAKAQSEANKELAASITPTLVQYRALEKWDGQLPTYTGGGALPFINVNPTK